MTEVRVKTLVEPVHAGINLLYLCLLRSAHAPHPSKFLLTVSAQR